MRRRRTALYSSHHYSGDQCEAEYQQGDGHFRETARSPRRDYGSRSFVAAKTHRDR